MPLCAADVIDNCNVPHFTVKEADFGDVSTKAARLSCDRRALALGFFGKVSREMAGDANAARSGGWTANGDQYAAEAIDLAAKNSAIKNGIDVLVAKVKFNDKLKAGGKALASASITLSAKGVAFAGTVFCPQNTSSCASDTIKMYGFVSDSLKLVSQAVACIDGKGNKCVDAVKTSLKQSNIVLKWFGKTGTDAELQRWATFISDWVGSSSDLARAFGTADTAAYTAASGALIDTAIQTYTGKYWRKDGDVPTGFNNLLEILGEGTSTWLVCKGAAMSLAQLRPGTITGVSADCVGKLNTYFNTRIAEMMGYSMVLFKASDEQYKAQLINGARVVMGEVIRLGGWNEAFAANGIAYRPGAFVSGNKDIAMMNAITAVAAKYGAKSDGLASLHSSWTDGFGGDVLRTINSSYWPAALGEANAILGGKRDIKAYAGVKFDTVASGLSVSLIPPNTMTWNAASVFPISAKSNGVDRGVSIQAVSPDGKVAVRAPMRIVTNNRDGSTDWAFDLSTDVNWKKLANGAYVVQAIVAGLDGRGVPSAAIPFVVERSSAGAPVAAAATPAVRLLSPDVTLRAGGTLTVRAEAAGAGSTAPVLSIRDQSGREVFSASFNAQLPDANGAAQWQFQKQMAPLAAGNYMVVAKVTGAGNKTVESNATKLIVEASAAPTLPPTVTLPAAIPSVTMLDFLPRVLIAGQLVKFVAQTSTKVKSVRVVFDQLTGGTSLDLANPSGNGIDWSLERPVGTAGSAANNYQRPIWATATALDGQASPSFGPLRIEVRPTAVATTVVPPLAAQPTLRDGMQFVTETISGGTYLRSGANTKTWTLRNSGSSTWTSAYCLRPLSGDALGSSPACVQGSIAPGGSYVFSVQLNVPAAKGTEATFRQNWGLFNGSAQVGSAVWVQIRVAAAGAIASPTAPVTSPAPALGLPTATASVSPASVPVNQTMRFDATLSSAQGVSKVELVFLDANVPAEPMTHTGGTTWSRIGRVMQSVGNERTFGIKVTLADGRSATVANGRYSVNPAASVIQPPVATPSPQPLSYQLTKGDNVTEGVVWSARLNTTQPIATAELVFSPGGRRIVFQGGSTSWVTDDRNAVFGDIANYTYTLQIQRQPNGVVETYPGGQLEVRARAIDPINPTVVSGSTAEQGKSYVLQVRVSKPAARVSSQWADVSEGTMSPDASRTSWQMSRVAPSLQPMSYTVRAYDENNALVGQTSGTVTVVAPAPLRDAMQFVSETLRDDTVVAPSAAASKSWALRNDGTTTWTSAYCLRPQGAQPLGGGSACVNGTVGPGGTYAFTVNLAVPSANSGVQTIRQNWALMNASNAQVGANVWAQVKIAALAPPPPPPVAAGGRISNATNQTVTVGGSVSLNGMVSGGGVLAVRITYGTGQVDSASVNAANGTWSYSRVMPSAGQFSYTVTAHASNAAVQIGSGVFTVNALAPTPPPPPSVPTLPVVSNISINPSGSPVISFDVSPGASRVRVQIPGRTWAFGCSGSSRVTCAVTNFWAPAQKGTFTAEIEAFDAVGRSTGARQFTFTR